VVEASRWRLSPEPPHRYPDCRRRIRDHPGRAGIQSRTEAHGLSLQGPGAAARL